MGGKQTSQDIQHIVKELQTEWMDNRKQNLILQQMKVSFEIIPVL